METNDIRVKLSPWQDEVFFDEHRFKIVCAGRRSGKSVLSRLIITKWAHENVGTYWIVSPTYKQSKQIHWREIQNEIPKSWVNAKNEVELSLQLDNGSLIELKGAENPDNLRGVKLRGLVIDEIASIRNWGWLWSEVLRPTLTDYQAPAVFISTPKGFNHFYDLYEQGQRKEGDYKSWKYTSYDNPYISKEELDNAREELTEDTFQQEYMADFRKYTGLVYKEFNRETHVIEPFDIPDNWSIYRAFDWGDTNPTVCLWIASDSDDNLFIVDEFYEPLNGRGIDYVAGIVNAHGLSKRVTQSFGDPSGSMYISEMSRRGIYVTPANKEVGTAFNTWVRYKIEKVAERLKCIPGHTVSMVSSGDSSKGRPGLYIFSACKNVIKEFETYRWKEKSVTQAQDLNEPDVPEKANDHAMDALSYFACSYKKQESYYVPYNDISKKNWRIGS